MGLIGFSVPTIALGTIMAAVISIHPVRKTTGLVSVAPPAACNPWGDATASGDTQKRPMRDS
jgi:hypothetical protein